MRRRGFVTVGVAAIAAGGVARAQGGEAGLDLMRRFAATLTAHDMDGFAALFADSYVNHQVSAAAPPPRPELSQKQATVAFFAARLAGIPDLKVAIEATVSAEDKVAASFAYSGIQNGSYLGIPATGGRCTSLHATSSPSATGFSPSIGAWGIPQASSRR